MVTYCIGADVDSKIAELAIEKNKGIINRYRVPTIIPALREVLEDAQEEKILSNREFIFLTFCCL